MARGRVDSLVDSSSDDEEAADGKGGRGRGRRLGRAGAPAGSTSAGPLLLERRGKARRAGPGGSTKDVAKDEEKVVFEIRDFTAASSFERIAHRIALAAKKWWAALRENEGREALMREEFLHNDFVYELLFQLLGPHPPGAAAGAVGAGAAGAAGAEGPLADRLAQLAFLPGAHKLQRWFGVQHFLIVSVQGEDIDADSARSVLGAAVVAVQSASPPAGASVGSPPLSCFVPVEGGRRRRHIGELLSGGARVVYATDSNHVVSPSLEHLEGLMEFFWRKFEADSEDPAHSLMIGARFAYLADEFDSLRPEPETAEGSLPSSTAEGGGEPSEEREVAKGGLAAEPAEVDPVHSVQLFCVWPSFPRGSFVDNATYSELDPHVAPYWNIRVRRADKAPVPLTGRLHNLLEFRKEAMTVRSAEHSVQPHLPRTALASLSFAIQESLETILLPSPAEMAEFTANCLGFPVVAPAAAAAQPGAPSANGDLAFRALLAGLRGGRGGSRLAKFAELAAKMRCFKGGVQLWCQVLAELRRRWDARELPREVDGASPPTHRVGARGVRSELFEATSCLVQQKFELLQRSVEQCASGRTTTEASPAPTGLRMRATGAPLLAPPLLCPALLTEDMVMQRDMAAASITDPVERAELHGRELRSDVAAFRAANLEAELADFLAWRVEVAQLSSELLPRAWLERLWQEAVPTPASEQPQRLFEPEREAEMALHYLESIDGTQLLLKVFRTLLSTTLEELNQSVAETGSAHLRMLLDRTVAACLMAFRGGAATRAAGAAEEEGSSSGGGAEEDAAGIAAVGEVAEFPPEEALQALLTAVEAVEAGTRLADSLRAKLPGAGQALVEDLLAQGEAAVATSAQRSVVEELFVRSRALAQMEGREPLDGKGFFDTLPLVKEFVLLLQPSRGSPSASPRGPRAGLEADAGATRRMHAEIRERHMRLALARGYRLV